MADRFFAHSLEGRPHSEWQDLREHLEGVARLAAHFAEAFGAEEWGRLAGLWRTELQAGRQLFMIAYALA